MYSFVFKLDRWQCVVDWPLAGTRSVRPECCARWTFCRGTGTRSSRWCEVSAGAATCDTRCILPPAYTASNATTSHDTLTPTHTASSRFHDASQLSTQLSWLWAQCNDVISIVTSRCCAQTTRCLLAWLSWVASAA